MDNRFLAMDFIFYAVENGLNIFSEPKMNGKITLSIFVLENGPLIQGLLKDEGHY